MGQLKHLNVRPFRTTDIERFDAYRRTYLHGDLELPKGFGAAGVESAVAEGPNGDIASLTGTLALVCDPLIKNPQITNGVELTAAIYLLERTLAYQGQRLGAVDAYIAVPDHLTEYHRIVEKSGYVRTLDHCYVFRRPLSPDTHPLIGPEMEEKRRRIIASLEGVEPPSNPVE